MSNPAMLCDSFIWHSSGEKPVHGEHMFASRNAQQQRWLQLQHPEDCSVKRFLQHAIDEADHTQGVGVTESIARGFEACRAATFQLFVASGRYGQHIPIPIASTQA